MGGRRWINFLYDVAVFAVVAAVQLAGVYGDAGADRPPAVNDAMEVYDIGYDLAAGRGYGFDWDAAGFRRPWEAGNRDGALDRQLAHHGGYHATLGRPPLMPVLVAAVLWVHPDRPFATWRAVDAVLFAAAGAAVAGAVRRRVGWYASLAVVGLVLADPTRAAFVPGWWTEGLAFDGVAVLVAMAFAGASPRATVWGGGVTVGLLALDRSLFAVLAPALCTIVAVAATRRGRPGGSRGWLTTAAATMAVAATLQVPWWARNVAVSGRFLPLGTQGGMNLPDEYGDYAVAYDGWWTGRGMAYAWADAPRSAADRARAATPGVLALWPEAPPYAALVDAQTCRSTADEVRVADVGRRAAVGWVRRHPWATVRLFAEKVWGQTADDRAWLAALAVAGGVGLTTAADRRPVWAAAAMVGVYAVGIGLTHAVTGRFLVPILPALYAAAAAGVGGVARAAVNRPGRTPPGPPAAASARERTPAGSG